MALACALVVLFVGGVRAGEWPDDCTESTLPSNDLNHPDDQQILICLPADFNGALLIYAHGYVRPQEPLALPEELGDSDIRELVEQLLHLGFGIATSSYHKSGYAVEQAAADLNSLVDHVKLSERDIDAVYITGASEGGLIAAMLVEKYPEIYDGGLALCGPLAGTRYQTNYLADVRVLFDYYYPRVFSFGALDVPPDAHLRWDGPGGLKTKIAAAIENDPDGIAQVFSAARVACSAGNRAATNCAQDLLAYSVFGTNDLLATADGWPASNIDKEYSRSEDDAALNAGVERFEADPAAAAYARRYYRPSGLLQRPFVTLHTTRDPLVPYRHELRYLRRAALLSRDHLLTALPVDRAGHCAFTAEEVLGGFGALLLRSDSDLALALVDPLEALHDIIDVDTAGERVADLLRDQAREFVNELEDEFGFVGDARDGAEDAVDAGKDLGDNAKDRIEDLF